MNPVVALKTGVIIGKTLSFASFESIHQPIRDITFSEVRSNHQIRPPCLTEQGFAAFRHGYFCNNGVNQPMLKNYRGRFPFKLSTTSYIYPDYIIPNVERLGSSFDEIELVLFESQGKDNYPEEEEINSLKKISLCEGINYNVHLPIDIFLGDEKKETRDRGISVIKKVIKQTLSLNPSLYTLHLDLRNEAGQDHSDIKVWKNRITQSLEDIVGEGIEPNRISIENLNYPFEWIEDIIDRFGFSICLDIGHILLYEQDLRLYFDKYLSNTSVIHLHGHENGIDHVGIDRLSEENLKLILPHLYDYRGIVSLEVFSIDDLQRSLIFLEERWKSS
ncbi:MAG: sugar phosphate isomerase/epimerase [Deltaproteobacteria bacterium]|nr:sugar phosphate isomerase/epimerase [Deltaproteobacteria bacterium]